MSTFHFRHCFPVQIIVYLLICGSVCLAQKNNDIGPAVKFGKILPDQFTTQTKDSTAEAIVLYDFGEVTFDEGDNDLWQEFTHHVRIKILKKSAYDRATIQLPVRRGQAGQHEFISRFEGYTYNLTNGDVSINVLDKTGHFTEKASDVLWLEKYTLSNVREGSIIDYKYTVRTPFGVGYNPKTWRFQQDIPVNWSEYRITIPDYFYYKIMQGGYLSLAVSENKPTNMHLFSGQSDVGAVTYRFAVKDAPAFRDEAYITTDDDYLSKIDFELASYQLPGGMKRDYSVSWTAMDKTLLDHSSFGDQIKRTGFLKETAKTLLSQHRDTLSRITAAYDFIRQNIKWNEQVSIWSDNIKKVFDDKKGDAADINLLLIALLREMNIDAYPVILSTRSHGRIYEDYALLKRFDYVVASVSVSGKDMLLDATDSYLKPGMLPLHCLNGTGRVVHPTQARFVSLAPVERDVEVQTGQLTLNEEGEVSGTLTHSHAGYSAWSARKVFAAEGQAKYLEGIRKERTSWQIEKAEFNGTDAKSNTFDVVYNFTIPEACTRAGDRLYFRPLLSEAHETNPFKEAQRLYPVDFGVLTDETFTVTYTLPAGYQVEELPKPVSMSLPENAGRFIYNVATINGGSQLQVISRISLRKTMYFADEYFSLRELFSQIVAKHAEQVVLKRGTIAEKK
jgi:transglutaminase-like putative cysteine protease